MVTGSKPIPKVTRACAPRTVLLEAVLQMISETAAKTNVRVVNRPPTASHLICSRSTPVDLLKRMKRELADATRHATHNIIKLSAVSSLQPSMARGFPNAGRSVKLSSTPSAVETPAVQRTIEKAA